jgi:hypothetical protein
MTYIRLTDSNGQKYTIDIPQNDGPLWDRHIFLTKNWLDKVLRHTHLGRTSASPRYLVSATLSEGVYTIENLFEECVELLSVHLPKSLLGINPQAFNKCLKLTRLSLPPRIRDISRFAFTSSHLLSITIPKTIKTIRENTFFKNPNLFFAVFLHNKTQLLGNAFFACPKLTFILAPIGFEINHQQAGIAETVGLFYFDPSLKKKRLPDKLDEVQKLYAAIIQTQKITEPKQRKELKRVLFSNFFDPEPKLRGIADFEQAVSGLKFRHPKNKKRDISRQLSGLLRLSVIRQYRALFGEKQPAVGPEHPLKILKFYLSILTRKHSHTAMLDPLSERLQQFLALGIQVPQRKAPIFKHKPETTGKALAGIS